MLELDEGSLKLLQPETGMVLNAQPIHAIRDNNNTFPNFSYIHVQYNCSLYNFIVYTVSWTTTIFFTNI